MNSPTSSKMVRTLLCVWIAAAITGLTVTASYANRPAPVAVQPKLWPTGLDVFRDRTRPTLMITLHPRCSCSEASLAELSRLLTEAPGRANVQALVYEPTALGDMSSLRRWTESRVVRQVQALPGVTVTFDAGGAQAERFGMSVSGQVALYSADGYLLFSGGITGERGHVGDNRGHSAIVHLLLDKTAADRQTPVFGCSLIDRRRL